ncbi:homoserine dehydrogenase [Bacillus benzoevorans]
MTAINVALLGFGTVGQGVYEIIQTSQERLQFFLKKPVKIAAVLVNNKEKHKAIEKEVLLTDNFEEILGLPQLDIVIDAIVGNASFPYLKRSIERGCHIVTANKEMFASHGEELLSLAARYQTAAGFEATVGGGIPVIQTLRKLLNINRVTKVEGIINGTSNFILTSMREEDQPFADTLKIAQEKGYAEADPTNDIEGFDAYYKALVLSQVVYGELPQEEHVYRKGITSITQNEIQQAEALGLKFKHVAKIEKYENAIQCRVQPVLVSASHSFYGVEGVQNAVSIDADIVGNITLTGAGAGKYPTASAVIEDLLHLYQEPVPVYTEKEQEASEQVRSSKGKWLIFNNSIDASRLPQEFTGVDRLNEQTLYFEAVEKDVRAFEKQSPEIAVYPVEGEFFFAGKTLRL